MSVDHPARAERLRAFYEEWSKVNDESLAQMDPPVELPDYDPEDEDPDAARVPYRYVANTWDGSSTWLEFSNDLDTLRDGLAGEINGEVPWAPGDVLDLDTGERWTTLVSVRLQKYRWRVAWEYTHAGITTRPIKVEWRFTNKRAARRGLATARLNDDAREIRLEPLP